MATKCSPIWSRAPQKSSAWSGSLTKHTCNQAANSVRWEQSSSVLVWCLRKFTNDIFSWVSAGETRLRGRTGAGAGSVRGWLQLPHRYINRQMHLSTLKKQLFRFVTASTCLEDIGCHQCRGETCVFEWQGQKMRLDFWWRWSTFYRVRWRWSRLRLSQRFNPKEENALVTVSEDGTGPWISYHSPSLRYW